MTTREFDQSEKLKNVLYEIRGPVAAAAEKMELDGHRILKLNTGNPAIFGFDAPDVIMRDMIAALPHAQGYSTSKGILPARRAIVTRYETIPGFPDFDVDDVYIGTPAVIDRRGVRHVVELDLDEDESQKFAHSADVLRTVMREAGL